MLIDGNQIEHGSVISTEVCVIGAGAAVITIALELNGTGIQTTLLESGGLEYDDSIQELYAGKNAGTHYHSLDACRLRYFGGTTNHWGGWCRPLDEIDFETRP